MQILQMVNTYREILYSPSSASFKRGWLKTVKHNFYNRNWVKIKEVKMFLYTVHNIIFRHFILFNLCSSSNKIYKNLFQFVVLCKVSCHGKWLQGVIFKLGWPKFRDIYFNQRWIEIEFIKPNKQIFIYNPKILYAMKTHTPLITIIFMVITLSQNFFYINE